MVGFQFLFFGVLCISIALGSFFLCSVSCFNRWLRIHRRSLFDFSLCAAAAALYLFIFLTLELLALFLGEFSFLQQPLSTLAFMFCAISVLVALSLHLATGGLTIRVSGLYVDKIFSVHGDSMAFGQVVLRTFAACNGELILDTSEKRLVIARLPLSTAQLHVEGEVMVECSWEMVMQDTLLVQLICYPATRGRFIERGVLQRVLHHLYDVCNELSNTKKG